LRWPCFVCSSQSNATTFYRMSGYLTLGRVRTLPAEFCFLLIAINVVVAETKTRSHRYGANHGLNWPLSAIVINAKAGMIE
jgi:hypothetical protein